jgi:hypothetical protein
VSAYRTNAAALPAQRPVLTRWQRTLVAVLGDNGCARFAWFRAYIGGRWAHGRQYTDGRVSIGWGSHGDTPCPEDMSWRRCEAGIAGTGCSCEAYPWPSLYSAQTPEEARDFAEFREWYDRVRVVDLSRVGGKR